MARELPAGDFRNEQAMRAGLTQEVVKAGMDSTYAVLDTIDEQLVSSGTPRLASLLELANLSAIVGNLFASGIVRASSGVFTRAGPHKYQDLRTSGLDKQADNIEIKVALETNTPKGHLAKGGHYLICRYVLGDEEGGYTIGERGDVVWCWEIRLGLLDEGHFNTSDTPGDSGKTAVVNREGMSQLAIIYADLNRCPYGLKSRYRKELEE